MDEDLELVRRIAQVFRDHEESLTIAFEGETKLEEAFRRIREWGEALAAAIERDAAPPEASPLPVPAGTSN